MGRQEQVKEVRRRVVSAARTLFLRNGYTQTTLREISVAAGVSYGSIYHHFADKEGIFLQLVLAGFERTQASADRNLAGCQDPYLRLGFKWARLVQEASEDARMAELMTLAYRSWKITDVLVQAATAKHQSLLQAHLPDWSYNRFLAATLVLKGAMASVIDERMNLNRLSAGERIEAVLTAALPGFGLDQNETLKTIDEIVRRLEVTSDPRC